MFTASIILCPTLPCLQHQSYFHPTPYPFIIYHVYSINHTFTLPLILLFSTMFRASIILCPTLPCLQHQSYFHPTPYPFITYHVYSINHTFTLPLILLFSTMFTASITLSPYPLSFYSLPCLGLQSYFHPILYPVLTCCMCAECSGRCCGGCSYVSNSQQRLSHELHPDSHLRNKKFIRNCRPEKKEQLWPPCFPYCQESLYLKLILLLLTKEFISKTNRLLLLLTKEFISKTSTSSYTIVHL